MKKKLIAVVLGMTMLFSSFGVCAEEIVMTPDELVVEAAEVLPTDSIDEITIENAENLEADILSAGAEDELDGVTYTDLTGKTGSSFEDAYTIGAGNYKLQVSSDGDIWKNYYVKYKIPSNLCYVQIKTTNNSVNDRIHVWEYDNAGGKIWDTDWISTNESTTSVRQYESGEYYYFRIEARATSGWVTFSLSFIDDPEGKDMESAVTLKPGVVYTGNLTRNDTYRNNDDNDYFTFKTGKAGHYQIDMHNIKNGKLGFVLYDELGTELDRRDWIYEGNSESIYKTLEANKQYYVYVHWSTDTNYSISYKYNEDNEGDTMQMASALTEGATPYQTTLCDPDDQDYYTFTAKHNCNYTIKSTRIKMTNSLQMWLFSDQGEELKTEWCNSDGQTFEIKYYLEKGKKYYLRMDSNGAGTYSLAVAPSVTFVDIPDNWAYDAIAYVFDNEYMVGNGVYFMPNSKCTRAMMVTILHSVAGKPWGDNINFADVKSNDWFYNPVCWAVRADITAGKSPTSFAPNADVTRQEMAVFLMKYAKWKGYSISQRANLGKFSDNASISGWARDAVSWANANGIINGKGGGRLDPKGNATRAEVATMIMSFQNKFGK